MRRPRAVMAVIVLVAVVLAGIAIAGGDDETTDPPPRNGVEVPAETTTPSPGNSSSLPPTFVRCMADQGYDVDSPDDIHAAPPQVLETCFGTVHQGGGTP